MNNIITSLQLVSGAMLVVWLSNIIDNKGIGNGTPTGKRDGLGSIVKRGI